MLAVRTASCSSIRCIAVSHSVYHFDELVSLGEPSRPRQHPPSHRYFASCAPPQAKKTGGVARKKQIRAAQSFAKGLKDADFIGTKQNPTEKTEKEEIEGTKDKTADEQIGDILANPPTPPWKQKSSWWGDNPKDLEREEKRYRKLYKAGYTAVDSAFLLAQLRDICDRRGLSKAGPKPIVIQNIMSHYGWEVPGSKAKQEVASEVEAPPNPTITLDMPPHELFLFLRDRRLLEDLILHQGVRLSTTAVPASSPAASGTEDRLILTAEADEAALTRLQLILRNRTTYMKKLEFRFEDLGGPVPSQGVINFVSSSTGAFVGTEGQGFVVYSMDERKTKLAKHMLQSAVLKSHRLLQTRKLAVITPPVYRPEESSGLYSVLPFFPSPTSIMPWQSLKDTYQELMYRLSRNKGWHSTHTIQSSRHRTEDMANSNVTDISAAGDKSTLQELFEGLASNAAEPAATVQRVTLGHLLFRHETTVPAGYLTSPIPGRWTVQDNLSRVQGVHRPIFAPALAPAAVHTPLISTVPRVTQRSRRLTYRSADGAYQVTFTHMWPAGPAPGSTPVEKDLNLETENWLAGLKDQISAMEAEEDEGEMLDKEADEDDGQGPEGSDGNELPRDKDEVLRVLDKVENATLNGEPLAAAEPDQSAEELGSALKEGQEFSRSEEPKDGEIVATRSTSNEADLLMPDRPIDARLTVSENTQIDPTSVPEPIKSFFTYITLPAGSGKPVEPVAPFEITLDGTEYALESNEELNTTWSSKHESTVVLRNVKVKDMMINSSRTTSYTEMEFVGKGVPDDFWSEWANTAREVDPAFAGSGIETTSRFSF